MPPSFRQEGIVSPAHVDELQTAEGTVEHHGEEQLAFAIDSQTVG